MNLLEKILEKLNGLHYPQEYLCLSNESFQQPLHLYLVQQGKVVKDITTLHSFVGYCPLLFVVPFSEEISNSNVIEMVFSTGMLETGKKWKKNQVVASLHFKHIKTQETGTGKIFYFEGVEGRHRFTSVFHQLILQWHNELYNKTPGNVFLKGNLYKQVQMAYALPRKICLITVGSNNLYNLFPTDLHGQVNQEHYVISLRHAGKACEQVMQAQKIVLSDMKTSAYKKVYSLGKNHMQPLKEASAFDFSSSLSEQLQLPLPKDAVQYKELQLLDSFTHGIHRLLLFKIINTKQVDDNPQTLAHIHNVYATWRYKKRLPSNYLLR